MINMKKLKSRKFMYRKSQINLDLIVSYILFIVFIGFLMNFSVKLTEPFSNVLSLEKENTEMSILSKKMPRSLDISNIGEICDITQENLESVQFKYDIIGFEIPEYDCNSPQLNETEGGMLIERDGKDMRIYASSNEGSKEYSLLLQFPKSTNAVTNETNMEGNDAANIITDKFGGKLVLINMSVNNTDSDELHIYTQDSGFVTIQQFSGERLYIGSTPKQGQCGRDVGGNAVTIPGYILIINRQKDFLAKYSLTGGWMN